MQQLTRRTWLSTAVGAAAAPRLVQAANLPRPAGEMIITLPSRSLVRLSDYRGKVVALEFLLTTCPHCQRCSQVLQKITDEFAPQGFQALGAAINDGAMQDIPRYVAMLGVKFPVGISPRDEVYKFLQLDPSPNKPAYMPQLAFIDRAGQIRHQFAGTDEFFLPEKEEDNIRNIVRAMLAAGSRPAGKKS